MTIANIITVIRILLVPIFLVILLTEMENKEIIAFLVFLVAAISDAVDGYFARKLDQVTELGKFLDPLADKLLVVAALLALVHEDVVAAWVATVIILREILIAGFRFYFLVKDSAFSASWLAKKKTMFQIISISVLMIHKKLPYPDTLFKIGTYLLYFAVFLTVYSGVEYVIKYSRTSPAEKE